MLKPILALSQIKHALNVHCLLILKFHSVHVAISSNLKKIMITCPQCMVSVNKSTKTCVCGYIFGQKEKSSIKALAMRKRRANETPDETIERKHKKSEVNGK